MTYQSKLFCHLLRSHFDRHTNMIQPCFCRQLWALCTNGSHSCIRPDLRNLRKSWSYWYTHLVQRFKEIWNQTCFSAIWDVDYQYLPILFLITPAVSFAKLDVFFRPGCPSHFQVSWKWLGQPVETSCFAKLTAGVLRKRIRNGYPARTHSESGI